MKHGLPEACRRPAVRGPDAGSIDDGSADPGAADNGVIDDGPVDDGSARGRSGNVSDEPDRVRRQIRDRAERIERDEVEEAVSKLGARGDLTDEQRETVRLLGAVLTRRIMTAPESALERASRNDRATVRTVSRLFDVESE